LAPTLAMSRKLFPFANGAEKVESTVNHYCF